MRRVSSLLLAGMILSLPAPAFSQETQLNFGGDQYTAAQQAAIETAVERDAFMAGYNVTLGAPVSGDAHLAGFNVNSEAQVAGDVYAAAFNVTVNGPIGGDLTAAGNGVSLAPGATIGGNARLAGASVSIGTTVQGAALVTAQTLTLGGTINGDLSFFGENITFAPDAKVNGTLSIQAPREIAVPASVAPADRVTYQTYTPPDYVSEAGRTAENVVKGFWPAFWAAAAWWVLLLAVGAAMIALLPGTVHRLEEVAQRRPFRTLGIGIIALAATLGLVPVTVLTLVGILLLPLVLVFVAVWCSLGYLAGSYLLGRRIAGAFMAVDGNPGRLAVLAGSLVAAIGLGMIPFIGWLLTLLVVVFGLGVMGLALVTRWTRRDAERPASAPMAPAAATPGP